MPTRKRPQPELPPYGFSGELPNLDGSSSTELAVTIPHPTKPGFFTNVPSIFPGQNASTMMPGGAVTPEQWQRIDAFAKYLAQSGYELPTFKTIDEAVAQAQHRHKAIERIPSQLQGPPMTLGEYQKLTGNR